MLIGLNLNPFRGGKGNEWSQRALRLTTNLRPVQSILLAFIADELLRVLLRAIMTLG